MRSYTTERCLSTHNPGKRLNVDQDEQPRAGRGKCPIVGQEQGFFQNTKFSGSIIQAHFLQNDVQLSNSSSSQQMCLGGNGNVRQGKLHVSLPSVYARGRKSKYVTCVGLATLHTRHQELYTEGKLGFE